MKGFRKKLTTVMLVLLMLTQQMPVSTIRAEDVDIPDDNVTQTEGDSEAGTVPETVVFEEEDPTDPTDPTDPSNPTNPETPPAEAP